MYLVHDAELRHGGHVETRARFVECPDDLRQRLGLDRVVGLYSGQILLKGRVVAAELVVVHHEKRCAVYPAISSVLLGII